MLITTFNRGPLLQRSLERLAELTLPDQLVVVNDGGEDDCSEVVAEFATRTGVDAGVYYLDNSGRTMCSKARNFGLQNCDHEYVLTSEPEVIFKSDVIAQLLGKVKHTIVMAGSVWYAPADWNGDLGNPGEKATVEAPYVALFRKRWLEMIGGWDEGFPAPWGGDDVDLLARLQEIGVEMRYAEVVEVIHQDHGGGDVALSMVHASANSRYFWRKPFNHGRVEHICSEECQRRRGVIL
jgi:GT2 family glycosyltransferase